MFAISTFSEEPFSSVPAGGVSVSVSVTGVSATGAVGDVVVTTGVSVFVTGVEGTGQVGTVTVLSGEFVNVIGVEGTGQVGVFSCLVVPAQTQIQVQPELLSVASVAFVLDKSASPLQAPLNMVCL